MELTDISGIGAVRKKYFEEMGISTPLDLLNYFPYKYYDFSKTEPYSDDGKVRLIKAQAIEPAKIVRTKTKLSFVSCKMIDEVGHTFSAIWFNQPYMKSQLFLGAELYLFGKNSPTKKNNFVVIISKFQDKFKTLGLLPVYKNASKIGQSNFQNAIFETLQMLKISTFIPNELLHKYNLMDLSQAYSIIHKPSGYEEINKAKDRVEIENLIPLIAVGEYHKTLFHSEKLQKYNNFIEVLDEYEKLLPFSLTPDQRKAIFDIEKDMSSKFSMNRLLQGDVGSGKTAVAFFAAFFAAKNNFQSAFIAPTEILAAQHYETACKLFKNTQIEVVLLTGLAKGTEKKQILQKIASNEAKIIIGTHALLSESVEFANLTFITIDEQHRFGVEQRKILKNKGITPDILVMSATPIPRSLSLVLYGELDISLLTSRPKSSKIITNLVNESKQNDMWEYIKNKLEQGSKAYVVCSKIDEQLDDEETIEFSAKNMYKMLSLKFGNQVGLLHGKISKESQNQLINNFKTRKIKLLVSTTVVEVGVDIPDADIMVIATPERFGLATLHQLRGRIGRNGQESHCFCLANNLGEKSFERLNFFKNNNDGFKIAEYDIMTRGSGSILGTNQHGKDGSISFSPANYSTAKQILEHLKGNISLYAQILSRGEELQSTSIISKIVLN